MKSVKFNDYIRNIMDYVADLEMQIEQFEIAAAESNACHMKDRDIIRAQDELIQMQDTVIESYRTLFATYEA